MSAVRTPPSSDLAVPSVPTLPVPTRDIPPLVAPSTLALPTATSSSGTDGSTTTVRTQYVLHVTSPVSLLTQTHILYSTHSTHCLFTLVVNYINYNYTSLPSSAVAEPQAATTYSEEAECDEMHRRS